MSNQAVSRDPLLPRKPDGTRRGVLLSVLVHIGLVIAIALGLNWRSRVPAASEAELWAAVPQAAAPREVEPVVPPTPPAPPPPAPVVKPTPKVIEPPAPLPDAQIAIEKARKEELRKEELRKEELHKEQERKEQERLAQEAAERESLKKKLALEKAEKAEKAAKAEKDAKAERERIAKQEAEKKKKVQEALDAKQREAARAEQLARIKSMAGASGDAGAKGSALRSAGPSAGYAGRIKARVRPNIVFADQVAGNPSAEVEVRAAPDGTIIGRRLVKSSGIPTWDDAVLRAIDKTAVLPRDTDGRVPPTLLLVFQPGE